MPLEFSGQITQAGQTVASPMLPGDPSCLLSIRPSSTFTGFTLYLEGSDDGSNWYPLAGYRPDLAALDATSYPLSAADNTNRQWIVDIRGQKYIRLRASALGSGTVAVHGTTGPFQPSPVPIVQVAASTPAQGSVQRVNAGYVAPGQSTKTYAGKTALSIGGTTTVTLETVTAGKTFIITDIYLSHDTSAQLDCRLQAAGVDIFRAVVKGDTAPLQMAGMETQPVATSGQSVTLLLPQVAGATNAYYFISGIEQ